MIRLKLFVPFVLVALLASPGLCQDDPNTLLMKQIYTKIGQSIGVGSNDPEVGQSFLVLVSPGILLDPNLPANTADGRRTLARSIDRVMAPNWIYGPRPLTTWEVYNRIMLDHEAAVVNPSPEQKALFKKYCEVIHTNCNDPKKPGDPTAAYLKYRADMKALAGLNTQAEKFRRDNNTPDIPADLADDIQAATEDLEAIANRADIDAALAGIRSFEHIDPNAWWGELAARFGKLSETIGGNQFGPLSVYPSYPVWLDMTRSWSAVKLTQNDLQVTTSNSSTSVGGGGSFNAGLWSVGGDYDHEENRSSYQMAGKNISLNFEVTTVTLDRLWMDEAVFESRAWKWLKATAYDKRFISSGADAKAGKTPPTSDIMPFLPTGLLLARKTSLSADWATDLATSFSSHTGGSASVGWGPFRLSGRYDHTDSNSYHEAHAAGNMISWDAPQIIGVFVQVLGKGPDPDRCLHFASDPSPLPDDCKSLNALYRFSNWNAHTAVDSGAQIDRSKRILREAHEAKMKLKQ